MRASSLQVKVTLAIVLSLLIIDGVGAAVAEFNFRESEMSHAREESRTRVSSLARVLDVRLHALGQAANDAAEGADDRTVAESKQALARAGFTSAVLIGPGGVEWLSGEAESNASLAGLLTGAAPPEQFPGRTFFVKDQYLIVGIRTLSAKHALVGALHRDVLSSSFLVDVLIEATAANVVVTKEGETVAASQNFPGVASVESLDAGMVTLGDGEQYLVEREPLTRIQGFVAHLVPMSSIESQVDQAVLRFVATSSAAVVLAGIASVLIVAYSLRPLKRITDAARRLGAGEEDLRLEVRSRDEMGVLAGVLNQSARAIGDARRQQEAHANELRLAAEDFQVAVGALARSVGEADTAPEVARRLAEAVLLVTPTTAVAVQQGARLLEIRLAANADDANESSVRALFESDPDAFRWFTMRAEEDDVLVAVLPREELSEGASRKVEILLNQAALAFHRAKSMDKLRLAHDELDHLLRQKQVYLDILSHDLKNPIAVARGRAEILALKHPDLAEKVRPIEHSLDRATKIIEESVLYAKLEREKQLDRPVVDLALLAAEAVHSLQPLAATRGIEVVATSPPSVPWRANHLIVRAIENLLSNAIKWSPERSTVVVDVEPTPNACRIRVVDHGPGIPVEDRPRLFARFERADRTGVKGVGLGLAIAKRVIDMHQGRIGIEDTPGGGCTFVVEIPGSPLDASRPSPSPAPRQEGPR